MPPACSDRIFDRSGPAWRWCGMRSLESGRVNVCVLSSSVSSTECVTVMVEVGAHAPTSHPSQSPSGIKTSTACQPAGREKSRGSWSKLTATCVCGLTLVQEGVPISTELSPRSLQVCKGCRCCHIVTRGRSKWSQNKKWQEPEILVQIPLDNSVCVH